MTVSFLAFVRQFWLLHKYQHYQSRHGFSCCELARQLLDKTGFPQAPVQAAGVWECFRTGIDKQLFLEESVYKSHNLYAVAQTAERVVALSKASGAAIPVTGTFRLRVMLRFLLIPAWIFFILESVTSHFAVLGALGQTVLQLTLMLGIFELSRDWETSQEALELLKKTEIFEADELVKLRGLLSALKWRGLAEIFKVPFDTAAQPFRKQENNGL